MKVITKGDKEILIDDRDLHWISGQNIIVGPEGLKLVLHDHMRPNKPRYRKLSMLIMEVAPPYRVYHRDGNPFNLQRANLLILQPWEKITEVRARLAEERRREKERELANSLQSSSTNMAQAAQAGPGAAPAGQQGEYTDGAISGAPGGSQAFADIRAMDICSAALEGLDKAETYRVMAYLVAKYTPEFGGFAALPTLLSNISLLYKHS